MHSTMCCPRVQLVFTFVIVFFLGICNGEYLNSSQDHQIEARKKKDKYLLTLVLGGLIVKAIVFPIAMKVMAAMTSVSVLLSVMSLIISSIIGYIKVALKHNQQPIKIVHVSDHMWSKEDGINWSYEREPYYHDHDHDHYYDS